MINKSMVATRLEKLREYLKILEAVRKYDLDRFKTDPFIHGTAERYLHLSIECLLDIGNHVIADQGFRKPETYGDIFQILADEGIISSEVLREVEGMAAFRNVLVHDYVRLDREKVYRILGDKLRYFDEMASIYAALM